MGIKGNGGNGRDSQLPVPKAGYEIVWGDEMAVEPSTAAKERMKAARQAEIDRGAEPSTHFKLGNDELELVVYRCYHVSKPGGVILAGGLIPQAKIRVGEIDRRPYSEVIGRAEAALGRELHPETEH